MNHNYFLSFLSVSPECVIVYVIIKMNESFDVNATHDIIGYVNSYFINTKQPMSKLFRHVSNMILLLYNCQRNELSFAICCK